MRNIYLLTILSFASFKLLAQTTCDTINMPVPNNWSDTTYEAPSPFFGFSGGYINGVNWTGNYQKANYFDLSSTSNNYILGAIIKFGKANSTSSGNLSKLVFFKVYDDNGGMPGNLLTTAQTTLGEIKNDISAGLNTNINFASAIALPASKKFYVSVDVSNFTWTLGGSLRDTLWIAGTADDETANSAWEFNNDSVWIAYPDEWSNPQNQSNPLDVTLWIFPYVSNAASGCEPLPVQLISFNAERTGKDVILKWQVANEINMKGYEVERADNNNIFRSVTFVPASNNSNLHSYATTDKNPFSTSAIVQYRLKQINADGSSKYSEIVSVKYENGKIVFENPFTGTLQLQLNLTAPQMVSAELYDIQGKLVAAQQPVLYSATNSTIHLNGTAGLKPGSYILRINAGSDLQVYKVLKQ